MPTESAIRLDTASPTITVTRGITIRINPAVNPHPTANAHTARTTKSIQFIVFLLVADRRRVLA